MRTPLAIFFVFLLFIVVDVYLYFVIRSLTHAHQRPRLISQSILWTSSAATLLALLLFIYFPHATFTRNVRQYLFAIVVIIFLSKLLSVVFFVIDDLRRGVQWLATKLLFRNTDMADVGVGKISRSVFLSWLGVAAGGTLVTSMVYGFSNKYNYQIKRIPLKFDNLPAGFKGMKVVQFSDVHCGSFNNKRKVMRGVEMIMRENADLIIFNGDLVNDMTSEVRDYMDVFGKVQAPLGVFSVLGNHDYGDYITWPVNGLSKKENLEQMVQAHADLGWKLLRNEHVVIERNGDRLPLIGVENWSNIGRFPKYGDLPKAYAGTEHFPFKLLISHDPSHWDAQVRPEFPDIDMTFSGHTHGFQFGVEIPGFRWSPVQYVYKQWDGLYKEGGQSLYVNPGFGFIGYPGRVGILPQITVFEFV